VNSRRLSPPKTSKVGHGFFFGIASFPGFFPAFAVFFFIERETARPLLCSPPDFSTSSSGPGRMCFGTCPDEKLTDSVYDASGSAIAGSPLLDRS